MLTRTRSASCMVVTSSHMDSRLLACTAAFNMTSRQVWRPSSNGAAPALPLPRQQRHQTLCHRCAGDRHRLSPPPRASSPRGAMPRSGRGILRNMSEHSVRHFNSTLSATPCCSTHAITQSSRRPQSYTHTYPRRLLLLSRLRQCLPSLSLPALLLLPPLLHRDHHQ